MRAAWYEKNGPAREVLTLGELPDPEPGPGEVRVRVVASGVNPTDVKSRAGSRPMGFPRVIPHQDGAGVIDKVGAGVPGSRVGERVWLSIVQWQRPSGTAAEYACVPARRAITLPANTSFAEGACLGIPAVTAHRCLFADGSIDGQTVLVTGGAGVDRVVDVDFGANLGVSVKVVKTNGTIAAYASMGEREPKLPFSALMSKNVTVRPVLIYTMPEAAKDEAARDINALVQAGRLIHQIGARFPLERIVDAHEAQESGKVMGNIVVDLLNLDQAGVVGRRAAR